MPFNSSLSCYSPTPVILFSSNRVSQENLAIVCSSSFSSLKHPCSCKNKQTPNSFESLRSSSLDSLDSLSIRSTDSGSSLNSTPLSSPELPSPSIPHSLKFTPPMSPLSLSENTGLQGQQSRKPVLTLDKLPFDIRELIAQQCLQADAFRLSLTCKDLYDSSIPRIYQCIIFDSSHRHFNKEASYKRLRPKCDISYSSNSTKMQSFDVLHANYITPTSSPSKPSRQVPRFSNLATECKSNYDELFFSYSSVHTVGGMRRCIRTLARDPSKAAYIRRFEMLNNIDIADYEIQQFLEGTLPHMSNLAILVWDSSPFFTSHFLKLLCTKKQHDGQGCDQNFVFSNKNIETLSLDLKFSRTDPKTFGLEKLSFPSLRKLTIRPFISSEFLTDVAKLVSNSPDTLRNLQWLHMGRDMDRTGSNGSGSTGGSGGSTGLLSGSDPFFAFASLDPQGIISPAGSGGPVGNNQGVMGLGSNDRVSRGRAFWNLDGEIDYNCIPKFFNTLIDAVNSRQDDQIPRLPDSLYSYSGSSKLQLEYLGLTGIIVSGHKDFSLMERCIDLRCIVRLCLGGADSYNSIIDGPVLDDDNSLENHDSEGNELLPGFLPNFVSSNCNSGGKSNNRLQALRALTIDWTENGKDNVWETLGKLPIGLRSLKVIIRWSVNKAGSTTWSQLCEYYSNSIVNLHQHTLEHLVLDIGYDDTFAATETTGNNMPHHSADSHAPGGRNIAALSKASVKNLGNCKNLKGLSIAASSMEVMEDLIAQLPNLKYLRLRNPRSKPYLGQNTSYLLEDWLRYKHIVEGFWNAQGPKTQVFQPHIVDSLAENSNNRDDQDNHIGLKSLEFVKLEEYVFELQQVVSKAKSSPKSLIGGYSPNTLPSVSPLEPPLRGPGSSNMFEHLQRFDNASRKTRHNRYDIEETYGVGYYGESGYTTSTNDSTQQGEDGFQKHGNEKATGSRVLVSVILREGLTPWFTAKCEGETFVEEE